MKLIILFHLKFYLQPWLLYSSVGYTNKAGGFFDGGILLFPRQVDDFAIACRSPSIAQELITKMKEKVTMDFLINVIDWVFNKLNTILNYYLCTNISPKCLQTMDGS